MAEKKFGVRDLEIIDPTGTPTIESSGDLVFNTGGATERLRVISDGRIGIATDDPNSMGRVSIVVPSTGGHGAINIQNHEKGSGKTNIVMRSLDNNGGNWADAEFRAEGYSFKIRTTERFRIDFDGTVSDSMGPLRSLGINYHNAATYTLVASDAGKLVREATNSANITIPQNVFSAGDMISIFNVSSGDNTITSGAGITLYNTSGGATGNRTLASKGVCTIVCTSTNEFIISGSGLS